MCFFLLFFLGVIPIIISCLASRLAQKDIYPCHIPMCSPQNGTSSRKLPWKRQVSPNFLVGMRNGMNPIEKPSNWWFPLSKSPVPSIPETNFQERSHRTAVGELEPREKKTSPGGSFRGFFLSAGPFVWRFPQRASSLAPGDLDLSGIRFPYSGISNQTE